jgi:redox-sensitive bicupin YhaK (pirin superfamily)
MEIISYVVEGELTHADSMGNQHTLSRGQVQYMSAGTGVAHSEYNNIKKILRFMQI